MVMTLKDSCNRTVKVRLTTSWPFPHLILVPDLDYTSTCEEPSSLAEPLLATNIFSEIFRDHIIQDFLSLKSGLVASNTFY